MASMLEVMREYKHLSAKKRAEGTLAPPLEERLAELEGVVKASRTQAPRVEAAGRQGPSVGFGLARPEPGLSFGRVLDRLTARLPAELPRRAGVIATAVAAMVGVASLIMIALGVPGERVMSGALPSLLT